jgi:pimeloyl-ACP methyl ester carboxylesterase
VRGLRLHVAEAGEGDAVLLVHRWPQHWWSWRHLIPALARSHRVICPDLRGLGWSEAPADDDYRKETLVDDLIALLEGLGIERVRYVGHDWGAFLGFTLCLRPEHPVERLMALSVLPPWPPPGRLEPRRAARFVYQFPIAAPLPAALKTRYFRRLLRAGRVDGEWSAKELATYLEPLRRSHGVRASTLLYRTLLLRELTPSWAAATRSGACRSRRAS